MKSRVIFALLVLGLGLFVSFVFGPLAFARLAAADVAVNGCSCGGGCICDDSACPCATCDGNCTDCATCCAGEVAATDGNVPTSTAADCCRDGAACCTTAARRCGQLAAAHPSCCAAIRQCCVDKNACCS